MPKITGKYQKDSLTYGEWFIGGSGFGSGGRYDQFGGYGGEGYNQGSGEYGSGYGGYDHGGYGGAGFGTGYGGSEGYGGGGYRSRDRYENRGHSSGNDGAMGLVGNLIGNELVNSNVEIFSKWFLSFALIHVFFEFSLFKSNLDHLKNYSYYYTLKKRSVIF